MPFQPSPSVEPDSLPDEGDPAEEASTIDVPAPSMEPDRPDASEVEVERPDAPPVEPSPDLGLGAIAVPTGTAGDAPVSGSPDWDPPPSTDAMFAAEELTAGAAALGEDDADDDDLLAVGDIPPVEMETGLGPVEFVEIVIPESLLRTAMVRYGINIMLLSIFISEYLIGAIQGAIIIIAMLVQRSLVRKS